MERNRKRVKLEKSWGGGGSEEVTRLPDHVIAERRCQNAAEDKSMHVRQRTEDEDKTGDKRRWEKKRGQFRSQQKLLESKAKNTHLYPTVTRKMK